MDNATLTARTYLYRANGSQVSLVQTTWTRAKGVLALEVYDVTRTGLEVYCGTLIEQPDWADLLADLDGQDECSSKLLWYSLGCAPFC